MTRRRVALGERDLPLLEPERRVIRLGDATLEMQVLRAQDAALWALAVDCLVALRFAEEVSGVVELRWLHERRSA